MRCCDRGVEVDFCLRAGFYDDGAGFVAQDTVTAGCALVIWEVRMGLGRFTGRRRRC